MMKSHQEIVRIYLKYLSQTNFDKAKDFMEKQRSVLLSSVWPKPLFDISCDFAVAEKNYSDTNFEPEKSKLVSRKKDENYLDVVYKTLFQDLGLLQEEVEDSYILEFITSLSKFISIRIKLLEFYDKLYVIGSTNSNFDFKELAETIEQIQNEVVIPSPIDEAMQILKYELDSIKHLFHCHWHLENWLYLKSVISLKRGSDAIIMWEKCYENKESWKFGSLFTSKNSLPRLVLWFKKFKFMTLSKFTLYFYNLLLTKETKEEMLNTCSTCNLDLFTKMQLLHTKAEAQYVMLVFDSSELTNYKGPSYLCSSRDIIVDPDIKYHIMLSFPKVSIKLNVLEKLISENNEDEFSMQKCSIVYIGKAAYLVMRIDKRITFIIFYNSKPKSEEKEKSNAFEFISQLRCHRLFPLIYSTSIII